MPSVYNNFLIFRYDLTQRGFGQHSYPVEVNGARDVTIVIEEGAVQVVDAGVGMERSELDRMMRPFQRGQSHEGGHGLGLAIVQRLCERYEWELMVASEPGKGTQVQVRF